MSMMIVQNKIPRLAKTALIPPLDTEENNNSDRDKAGKREESLQLGVIVLVCYVIELLHLIILINIKF